LVNHLPIKNYTLFFHPSVSLELAANTSCYCSFQKKWRAAFTSASTYGDKFSLPCHKLEREREFLTSLPVKSGFYNPSTPFWGTFLYTIHFLISLNISRGKGTMPVSISPITDESSKIQLNREMTDRIKATNPLKF